MATTALKRLLRFKLGLRFDDFMYDLALLSVRSTFAFGLYRCFTAHSGFIF